MSIEIKQLLIKSNIIQRQDCNESDSSEDNPLANEELLAECRRMVLDIIREKEER